MKIAERVVLDILTERLENSDLSEEEALAWLAYRSHGDEKTLTRERALTPEIGDVGRHASALRDRVEMGFSLD